MTGAKGVQVADSSLALLELRYGAADLTNSGLTAVFMHLEPLVPVLCKHLLTKSATSTLDDIYWPSQHHEPAQKQ